MKIKKNQKRRFRLGSDGFMCTLPLSKKTYFKLYERPGNWCSEEELTKITQDLRRIAQEGQKGNPIPEYGVLKGDRKDLSQRVISIAYDKKTGDPLGFSAQIYLPLKFKSFSETVLHLGLIYISPQAQGKNISYLLAVLPNILILLKSGLRPIWVSNVSQVPAVVGLVDKNYSHSYPSSNPEAKQTFMHKKLSQLIMQKHRAAFGVGDDAEFIEDKQIITNAYTGGSDNMKKSFAEATKHKDAQVNALCEKSLNYDRGDDFLQLAILSPQSIIDLFKNKKSKQSRGQIAFTLAAFACFIAILPVIRWVVTPPQLMRNTQKQREIIYG